MKFLVHFIGGLHQSLQCAERNGDRGGNGCLVFFPGQRRAVNLHRVWDTFMLRGRKRKQSVAEYGATLNEGIDERQATAWAMGTPLDWVTEAWEVVKEHVYPPVAGEGTVPPLTDEDVAEGGLIVEQQIKRAGVRLAATLNAAFG